MLDAIGAVSDQHDYYCTWRE